FVSRQGRPLCGGKRSARAACGNSGIARVARERKMDVCASIFRAGKKIRQRVRLGRRTIMGHRRSKSFSSCFNAADKLSCATNPYPLSRKTLGLMRRLDAVKPMIGARRSPSWPGLWNRDRARYRRLEMTKFAKPLTTGKRGDKLWQGGQADLVADLVVENLRVPDGLPSTKELALTHRAGGQYHMLARGHHCAEVV